VQSSFWTSYVIYLGPCSL